MQKSGHSGEILGNHYHLIKLLGQGGYAEVYLAEHTLLGSQVAIKILKSADLQSIEQEQFRYEARILTTLTHPHIISVKDYGIENNKLGSAGSIPYLVMEYAPLGSLRHLYPHGTKVPLAKIVLYIKQIALALQYTHTQAKPIVHRDIKPENMLVRHENNVALSDFGIAVEGLATGNVHLQMQKIQQMMARHEQVLIPGTASYMAPERLKGPTQRASDQYSLAVVAYEWLCGKRPFEGTEDEICEKHANQSPSPIRQLNPQVPPEVEQVVIKGLAKNPVDRYPSVMDFAQALERAAQQAAQRASGPGQPTPPPSPTPSVNQPVNNWPSPQGDLASPVGPQVRVATPGPQMPSPSQSFPASQPPHPQPQPGFNNSQPWQAAYSQPQPGFNNGQSWQASYPQPQPGISSGPSFSGTTTDYNAPTVANTPQPETEPVKDPITSTVQAIRVALTTDPYFALSYKMRWFRPLIITINILLALGIIAVGFPANLPVAVLGGALAIFMLQRCVISLKPLIAMAFGAGVALWWGYTTINIAWSLSHSEQIAGLSSFIIFAIGIGLHYWFINNRLEYR